MSLQRLSIKNLMGKAVLKEQGLLAFSVLEAGMMGLIAPGQGHPTRQVSQLKQQRLCKQKPRDFRKILLSFPMTKLGADLE